MRFVEGDLDDPQIRETLILHYSKAISQTAPGSAHALDVDALKAPDIRFFSLWDDSALLGIGALRRLSVTDGEVKSMYVAETARRSGAGSAILSHIIAQARADGLQHLSLETGSWPYFAPARAFYVRHGFIDCAPFGDYVPDRNSLFMTLAL